MRTAGTAAAREAGRSATAAAGESGAFLRWAAPAVLLLAVLGGLIYFYSGRGEQPPNAAGAPNVAHATRPDGREADRTLERARQEIKDASKAVTRDGRALVETTRRMLSMSLPGNLKIDVPQNSYLESMVNALTDGAGSSLPKNIVADDLQFENATATLTAESATATSRLATVLKAFSTAKLKIEGHTDNIGDAAANKKESQQRATAVKDALVKGGVPADRVVAEGAGPDRPIASNDTEEGRARNRRIELSIVSK
jgi:outer membrane protein OmpA-like peptidoglycan-associated protein